MKADEITELANEVAYQTTSHQFDQIQRIRVKASPFNVCVISANRYPLQGGEEVTFATQLLVLQFGKVINEKVTYIVYVNED